MICMSKLGKVKYGIIYLTKVVDKAIFFNLQHCGKIKKLFLNLDFSNIIYLLSSNYIFTYFI